MLSFSKYGGTFFFEKGHGFKCFVLCRHICYSRGELGIWSTRTLYAGTELFNGHSFGTWTWSNPLFGQSRANESVLLYRSLKGSFLTTCAAFTDYVSPSMINLSSGFIPAIKTLRFHTDSVLRMIRFLTIILVNLLTTVVRVSRWNRTRSESCACEPPCYSLRAMN